MRRLLDARLSRSLLAMALAVAAAACTGCASGSGSSESTGTKSGATAAYERGAYTTALSEAEEEYRKSSGARKEAAALTAGLSAQALGKDAEAERWLTPLLSSSDRQIRARASAAVGLIRADAGDHERAITLLTDAARVLQGDSGARAEFYAAESYAHLGRVDAARAHYRLAKAKAVDPDLRRLIDERLASGGYTVQLGAFTSEANARRMANDAAARCASAGVGSPQVVARTRPGAATLYTVRVGRFASKEEAKRAQVRLGLPGIVTLASGS